MSHIFDAMSLLVAQYLVTFFIEHLYLTSTISKLFNPISITETGSTEEPMEAESAPEPVAESAPTPASTEAPTTEATEAPVAQ